MGPGAPIPPPRTSEIRASGLKAQTSAAAKPVAASTSPPRAKPATSPSASRATAVSATKPSSVVKLAAKPAAKKKLVPCSRCGEPSEQMICADCSDALELLRELSGSL